MSYLDVPRLHFGGAFYTAPSTINNDPTNYLPGEGEPGGNSLDLGWNPNGVALLYLRGCKVYNYLDLDGNVYTGEASTPSGMTHSDDILLQAEVETPSPYNNIIGNAAYPQIPNSFAKLVDIDPDQQGRSAVYGMWLVIQLPGTGDTPAGFYGKMGIPLLRNMSGVTKPSVPNAWSYNAGGDWQANIADVIWTGDLSASPLLQSFQQTIQKGGRSPNGKIYTGGLSVKMTVNLHRPQPQYQLTDGDLFCYARVSASIGPEFVDEPAQFPPGRRLFPVSGSLPNMNAMVNTLNNGDKRLSVDMGASMYLKTVEDSISRMSLGDFFTPDGWQFGYVPDTSTGAVTPFASGAVSFSDQEVTVDSQYKNRVMQINSGVAYMPLSASEESASSNKPLALLQGTQKEFAEADDGMYIGVREPLSRQEQGRATPAPGTGQSWDQLLGPDVVTIQAFQFGVPYANQTLDLGLTAVSSRWRMDEKTAQWTNFMGPPDITINPPTTTDGDGKIVIALTVNREAMQLSQIRVELDSRMNFIVAMNKQYQVGDNNYPVSVLVWRAFTAPAQVTWDADILPILGEYAKLYPGMKAKLNIANEALVTGSFRDSMIGHMSESPFNPDFMPVTRDLSPSRMEMIVNWLEQQGGGGNANV